MYKKFSILILYLVSIYLIFSGCSEKRFEKIQDIVQINYKDITKISFRDGRNGELIETEDKEKINEFLKYVNGYKLKKSELQLELDGYIYYADFYTNDKKILRITFVNPLNVNGVYYDIIESELNLEKIEAFVKSIK